MAISSSPKQDVEKVHQLRSRLAQRLNVRNKVRFVSSLAAALLNGLFEHPAGCSGPVGNIRINTSLTGVDNSFSTAS
jgi:hypothetical protein